MRLKKALSFVLSMAMMISLLSALNTTVFAAEDLSSYSSADIEAINNIIENNGLKNFEKDAPSTWTFVQFWTRNNTGKKAPMRIDLSNKELMGTLDVSGMTALKYLTSENNNLTGLKVSNLANLKELKCKNNKITDLDLTGLTNLETLQCYDNALTSLDVSGLSKLQYLLFFKNKDLTTITGLSDCTSLKTLSGNECKLEQLDVSALTSLEELYCHTNGLTKLTGLTDKANLKNVQCYSNKLEALDVSGSTGITQLWCSHNSLKEIKGLNACTKLADFDCRKNSLSALDLSGLPASCALQYANNNFTEVTLPTGTVKIENTLNGTANISEIQLAGNKVVLTQKPDDGYAFEGWYTSPNMTEADKTDFSGEVSADITLYPKFSKIISTELTLAAPVKNAAPQKSIDTDEYTATVEWSPEVTDSFGKNTVYTATITITPNPNYTTSGIAENGYTLAGAETVENKESNVVTAVFPKTAGSSGGILTARCTVSFETNGGSKTAAKSVTKNSLAKEPSAPTKENFDFAGWYTDKELNTKYDFSDKVTESFTLYAKWTEKDNSINQIILTVGEKTAKVFGKIKSNDVAPKIVNDRTMLPARFVAENLGARVEWDGENKLITITGKNEKGEDVTILITAGAANAVVNGKEIKLDSPAFIENDRTYTPIRFISEELGAAVDWDSENKIITITKAAQSEAADKK